MSDIPPDDKVKLNDEPGALTRRPTSREAEQLLGLYFPALDHGFVSLVDYMGTDECIERAARVSYGRGTRRSSQTRGLIRYLRSHKHTTPSEMVELKFHCCMPIFVARQWIRHRTANVNEYSGRYSLIPMFFYEPEPEDVQRQSASNRQGRKGPVDEATYAEAVRRWREGRARAAADYEWLAGEDVARELARIDLPLSTYTQWYWKIDLHNLLHFLTLRADAHAQKEIRDYAGIMAGMLRLVAPLSYEAWIDYDVAGARMSRQEMAVLRTVVETWQRPAEGRPEGRTIVGCRGLDRPEVSEEDMRGAGMTEREIGEFVTKLKGTTSPPSFELDLGKGLPGSHFAERFGMTED